LARLHELPCSRTKARASAFIVGIDLIAACDEDQRGGTVVAARRSSCSNIDSGSKRAFRRHVSSLR
jgi:hypothetical protein